MFVELLRREEEWPPSPPEMKALYTHFYNEIVKHARNLVCRSCSCVDHDPSHFDLVRVTEHSSQIDRETRVRYSHLE